MTYTVGSMCPDCINFGEVNVLRMFYISLDEQIIKCQSNKCMFPYMKRSALKSTLDSDTFPSSPPKDVPPDKPAEKSLKPIEPDNMLSLDDYVNKRAEHVEPPVETLKVEEKIINFDFTSLLKDITHKTEEESKPPISVALPLYSSNANAVKTSEERKIPPKARITRCLSNVKTRQAPRKENARCVKQKTKKSEPTLIIEPETGKSMRPLDYIKHFLNKK